MARKSKYTPDQRAALRKARQKKQEKYWEDRAQSRVLATDRQVDDIRKDSDRAYRDARNGVRREIDKFYRDFATAAGISEDEARQKLSRGELQDFKKELERKRKIIQEMIQKSPNNRKLQAYDTEFEKLSKVRELTRKEALEANVSAEIVKLGGKQEQQLNARSQNVVRTALWMNSADLSMLGDVDAKLGVGHPEQVKRAAKENWQHGDFSDKIWDDKEKLIREAREVIEGGFARNKGAYDMAGDLMTRMNVSHSNALRLVRTEFNHLSNQAALAEYQAKGIKKYKFVSATDSRTCDVCADLNGKTFNVADAKVGLNFPPMHPNCRSVTTPVIDWDDEDEWDYSNIELDDDELKKLGLTDEDVSAIDADTPKDAEAPAPSLTVQQANQAIEDTQSVQRRAEQAEAIKQQGEAIESKARNLYDKDVGNIFDDIDRNERLNQKLYVDTPITLPQAAIEAENLDRVHIDIQKADLEALKLQARAAKLDESIPKPDPKRTADLEDAIERQKEARKRRQDADLPNDEVIKQATPKPFEITDSDAEAAIGPRTAFGKWWMKVRDGVERAKERFNAWVSGFSDRAQIAGFPGVRHNPPNKSFDDLLAESYPPEKVKAIKEAYNKVSRAASTKDLKLVKAAYRDFLRESGVDSENRSLLSNMYDDSLLNKGIVPPRVVVSMNQKNGVFYNPNHKHLVLQPGKGNDEQYQGAEVVAHEYAHFEDDFLRNAFRGDLPESDPFIQKCAATFTNIQEMYDGKMQQFEPDGQYWNNLAQRLYGCSREEVSKAGGRREQILSMFEDTMQSISYGDYGRGHELGKDYDWTHLYNHIEAYANTRSAKLTFEPNELKAYKELYEGLFDVDP